jgi:transcription-repair coupling factor (superfamily II helicase)
MADLRETLRSHGRAVIEGMPKAGLAYLLASRRIDAPLVVIAEDGERADALARDLAGYGLADVVVFPGEHHTPYEEVAPDSLDVAARLSLRHRVLAGDRPRVIVLPPEALLSRWMPAVDFTRATDLYVVGQEVDREGVAAQLVRCGYQRVNLVEDEGTFAIRGGIIDIYPPGIRLPVRIDLFGDEIASIKSFEPDTQRTSDARESIAVHPIREVVFDDESVRQAVTSLRAYGDAVEIPTRKVSHLAQEIEARHYFFGIEALWPAFYDATESVLTSVLSAESVVVAESADRLAEVLEKYEQRAAAELLRAQDQQRVALALGLHLTPAAEVRQALAGLRRVETVVLADDRALVVADAPLRDWADLAREMDTRRKDAGKGEILDPLIAELKERFSRGHDVLIACASRGHAERLRELLLGRKIDLPIVERMPSLELAKRDDGKRAQIRRALVLAPLSGGVFDLERGVAILTDVEILGTPAPRRGRRKRQKPATEGLSTLRDLRDGELVIHVDHGIGRYLGLSRLILNGVDGDYVHLEYQGGDKLYLPIYRLTLLQRYKGPTEGVRLDKLGGTRWERAKQRVKDAVLAMAHELLATQARRKSQPGFALPEPDEHFHAFAATFPYEETPDQEKAIADVLGDLTQGSPMDRLVCGDVGFGKTEVAVRAAYLTVLAKKQVAVLVPTTVLAEQHGETFKERLAAQGVTVEVLSRFRSPKEVNEILARLRQGAVDVLVGTHRLLSADVGFKDLGLLVVDEEHRFGVKHKERIKQFKAEVHVLTLTATPIPRTMHMAMVGMRDLSIIQTPPPDRTAIKTEVTRFDEDLIAEAIRKELTRGGQVFVVHNRVGSIASMADLVRRLVPEARVGVGHGQMTPETLEKVMVDFIHREINVLVCTVIIESGIDIPSANTLIINRADAFGLAQLHQLRGRIGRGRERAYAYLLLPRSEKITKDAAERLAVLKRFSDLGSGFSLASFDLDLRGAGDLLGADQSGHIAAVGFELYTELLAEAVERIKGEKAQAHVEPDIKLPVPAVLPESYVPEPMQRLAYYQRFTQATSDEAVFDVAGEIADLYGEAPDEVRNLAEVMVIRRRLIAVGAVQLSADIVDGEVRAGVAFLQEAPLDREELARRMVAEPKRYRLLPSGRLAITVPLPSAEPTPRTLLRLVRQELGMLPIQKRGGSVVAARA